jgi:hypothetical protein
MTIDEAVYMVFELMKDDAKQFKRGYTKENAILAVNNVYDVPIDELRKAVDEASRESRRLEYD